MKEYKLLVVSSYVIGLGLGILYGLLNVLTIRSSLTNTSIIIPIILVVVAIALPFCLRIINKYGYSYLIISIVMAVISLVICFIYAVLLRNSAMQYYPETTILQEVVVKGLIASITFFLTSYFIYRYDKKKLEADN